MSWWYWKWYKLNERIKANLEEGKEVIIIVMVTMKFEKGKEMSKKEISQILLFKGMFKIDFVF